MTPNEIEQVIERQRCKVYNNFMHKLSTCHNNADNCWRNAISIDEVRDVLTQAGEIAEEKSNVKA